MAGALCLKKRQKTISGTDGLRGAWFFVIGAIIAFIFFKGRIQSDSVG
jgi:dolichol kinase